jgi:hypothetical protein
MKEKLEVLIELFSKSENLTDNSGDPFYKKQVKLISLLVSLYGHTLESYCLFIQSHGSLDGLESKKSAYYQALQRFPSNISILHATNTYYGLLERLVLELYESLMRHLFSASMIQLLSEQEMEILLPIVGHNLSHHDSRGK